MYRGIVFDLDGTLVDSRLCFKTIRQQLGIPEGEWILEYLETLPTDEKALKHEALKQIELDAARGATLFPGVHDLLKVLHLKDVRLGIFTRNCTAVTQYLVEAFRLRLDLVITRDDAPPKPDPTGVLMFLSQWNIASHELLFVGDAPSDIECGKSAGVKTGLFTNSRAHNEGLQPHHIFPDYSQFLKQVGL